MRYRRKYKLQVFLVALLLMSSDIKINDDLVKGSLAAVHRWLIRNGENTHMLGYVIVSSF